MKTKLTLIYHDPDIDPELVKSAVPDGTWMYPEAGMHPKHQLNLAEELIAGANSPLVVLTHSEMVMLRVIRRIREGKLSQNAVKVHYLSPVAEGVYQHDLRLGADGSFLDEWPDGFFEEGYTELFAGHMGVS